MPRLLSLNLNHRTHQKAIPSPLIDELLALAPDILVLCEYVEGAGRGELRERLADDGLKHVAVSDTINYAPGRWHNQVLIASRAPIERCPVPSPAPDPSGDSNVLSVRTHGLVVTGVRAPAYKAAAWYAYWSWLTSVLDGDVALGDFNADPANPSKKHRVLAELAETLDYSIATPDDAWSFCRANGDNSRIDHALVRASVSIRSVRYESSAFVPAFTDHAALVLEC
jgi:endonuclease/exonuclease/phosphatase family metal-dependent hydrolase